MKRNPQQKSLYEILEIYSEAYDETYINTDPIKFPHRYEDPLDQECTAFISAVFAFGKVSSIFQTLEKILSALGSRPHLKLQRWKKSDERSLLGVQHRWVTNQDVCDFIQALSLAYRRYPSLESIAQEGIECREGEPVEKALIHFSDTFQRFFSQVKKGKLSRGLSFLISSPKNKSVCKRMNLFLRWVVREKKPDLGLWKCLKSKDLLLPMDTHLARIACYVGLIPKDTKSYSWKTVLSATAALCLMDVEDPIKYDFALSRLGILGQCQHKYVPVVCARCKLQPFCSLGRKPRVITR